MSPGIRASIALSLMVGFYLLAIGLSAGLFWFAWIGAQHGAGGLKVGLLAAVAGGTVLLSLRPRRDPFEPPGPEITHAQHPRLFEVLNEIARATNQPMPAAVHVAPDVNAAVLQHGGVLGMGGTRTMILGLPLLHVVTVDQLKAILAHEFGHYGGGDTRIGRLVYHTRAGLARTLTAVEGRWVEVVFEYYGRFVMRVSMAVARHQEFAADAFAARATSRRDMIDSLQTIERLAAHLPMFLGTNVLPVFQAGYRPPIGPGFAAYCAVMPASAPEERRDEIHAADRLYDSHPPLEERVAALEALGGEPSRPGDRRPASALLGDTSELEGDLYRFGPENRHALPLIAWSDVTGRVMIPYWRQVVEGRHATLKAVPIDALPTSPAGIMKLVRSTTDLKLKMLDDPEILQVTMHAIGAAVALRLIEAGWVPASTGGQIGTLALGTETIAPISAVYSVLLGETPLAQWADFCRRHGLSGALASTPFTAIAK